MKFIGLVRAHVMTLGAFLCNSMISGKEGERMVSYLCSQLLPCLPIDQNTFSTYKHF
jgi:hypothetical protein